MLTQLIDLLHKLDLDPTPKEIGEMLWLAEYLDAPSRETLETTDASKVNNLSRLDHARQTPLTPKIPQSDSAAELPSLVEQPTVAEEPQAKLYSGRAQEGVATVGIKGIDFRSPGVPALPSALDLARALRPFKHTTLSRTKYIFDEKASIDAAADAGNPIPMLRPAPSRWLDVVLIVDESPSMVIWHAAIQEFQRLLERQGAFRNVQLWRLQYESELDEPSLQIGVGNGREQDAHKASELIDPSGQRLILVVTDCVSPAWDRVGIATLLKIWGSWGPVALVQMLPKYLWSRTALSDMPEVYLRTKLPGLPNDQLDIQWLFDEYDDVLRQWLQSQENQKAGIVVPVVTFEPRALASWATALATGNSAWITGFFLPTVPLPSPTEDEFAAETDSVDDQLDAHTLVESFNKTASPTARKLARYLAAAPLTLPVMRLVQGAMLPDSLQVHLAEVFLSGLIERQTPEIADIALDEVQYEFVEGVREVILASSRISTAIDVISLVSDYIGERIGQPLDFRAWIAAPADERNYFPLSENRYFATIASKVLSHIGAEYRVRTSQIDTQLKKSLNVSSYTEINGSGNSHGEPRQESAMEIEGSITHDDVALVGIKAGSYLPEQVPLTELPNVKAVGNNIIVYGDEASAFDLAQVEATYLRGLYADCNELTLAADGPVDAIRQRQPRLQRVYVDLATQTSPTFEQVIERFQLSDGLRSQLQREFRTLKSSLDAHAASMIGRDPESVNAGIPESLFTKLEEKYGLTKGSFVESFNVKLSVLEAIRNRCQLVLLGDPGGGKSTLTRRLAGVLASQDQPTLDPVEQGWLAALTGCFGRWLLPVRVVLSRWAHFLPETATGSAADLIDECVRLVEQTATVRGLKEHLAGRLTGTTPTLLILLDGLDEVADGQKRATLLRAVQHFCQHYPATPLIVTCRSRPWALWQDAGEALPLPVFTIDKLTPGAIQAFVERWHEELVYAGRYTAHAAGLAKTRLLTAIADPLRQDLAEMAGTPLLLTMMARVNYDQGLPDSRAELYESYLRQLLWEWERTKLDERGQLTSLQRLLAQPTPPVPANNLELALAGLAFQVHDRGRDQDTVDIDEHELRDALESIYTGGRSQGAKWALDVLDLIHERSGLLKSVDQRTLQFSHRTFQEYLAARHLATGDTATVIDKLRAKIDHEGWGEAIRLAFGYQIAVQSQYDTPLAVLEELLPDDPTSEADWRRVLLLGEIYTRLLGQQCARLAQQRKRADRLIKQIPALLTDLMQAPTLSVRQRLAAGRYLAELDIDPPGLDDFVSAAGWHFKIGRYPVTNRQFRRFVVAGGYQDDRWWSDEEGRRYRDKGGWREPLDWDDAALNWLTQPVVGISWYEAKAYSAWLTDHLRQQGQLTANHVVRLPTEAEWEQVARSHDGRDYPWGNEFNADHVNSAESRLNQPTPVHMYPTGATPEGVWDFSGNVWEWSNTVDKDGWLWLRGGAYNSDKSKIGVSSRLGDIPTYRGSDGGFRVVVGPVSR